MSAPQLDEERIDSASDDESDDWFDWFESDHGEDEAPVGPETGEERALRRARRRVKALRDFYGHLAIYLVVNTVLIAVDLVDTHAESSVLGLSWAWFPLVCWGVFVLIHGVTVLGFEPAFGRRWQDRKMQQYLEEERARERRKARHTGSDARR